MSYLTSLLCFNSNASFSFTTNISLGGKWGINANEIIFIFLTYDCYTLYLSTMHFYTLELIYDKQRTNWLHYFLHLQRIHATDFISDNLSAYEIMTLWLLFIPTIFLFVSFLLTNFTLIILISKVSSSSISSSFSIPRVSSSSLAYSKLAISRRSTIILEYQFLIIRLNGELGLKRVFNCIMTTFAHRI